MEKIEADTLKSLIKSIIVFSKDGLTPERLLKEYRDTVGEDLPYTELGFQSLEAYVQSIPDAVKHKWSHGQLFYVLASGPLPEPDPPIPRLMDIVLKPADIMPEAANQVNRQVKKRSKKTEKRRQQRIRQRARRKLIEQPLAPTTTGYDFSGSVRARTLLRTESLSRTEYDFFGPRYPPVYQDGYDFSQDGPYRPLIESGLGYDFSRSRYHYMYSNSLVPKTEQFTDRPYRTLRKRPYPEEDVDEFVPFHSDRPTSRKRIRIDIAPRFWPGTQYADAAVFPHYMYDYADDFTKYSRHNDDLAIYRRLVREDASKSHKRVCKFYVKRSGCDKGELCWYLHVPGHSLTLQDRDRFDLPRVQCHCYLRTGCYRPDHCNYLHVSNHDLTPEARHKLRISQLGPCQFHAINDCWFGETCEWSHGTDTDADQDTGSRTVTPPGTDINQAIRGKQRYFQADMDAEGRVNTLDDLEDIERVG